MLVEIETSTLNILCARRVPNQESILGWGRSSTQEALLSHYIPALQKRFEFVQLSFRQLGPKHLFRQSLLPSETEVSIWL